MKNIYYKTGGALLSSPPDAEIYVERMADAKACMYLQRMDYITLIEPRQQGKTSIINRLMGTFTPQGYIFAYIDLTTITKRSSESSWYQTICKWLLDRLCQTSSLFNENSFVFPVDGYTWLRFLIKIAEHAEKSRFKLIVVLDEVGAMPSEWSTDFFSVIRSIYNQRQSFPCLNYISFIVSGVFNPRRLIKDPNISNFNVHQRVELPDFTVDEVRLLVMRLGLSMRLTTLVTEHIYDSIHGQPYLTQYLCHALSTQNVLRSSRNVFHFVTNAVEGLRRTDHNHLTHLIEDLRRESASARNYVLRILQGHRYAFTPAEHHIQAQLALIGIIREDSNGMCVIRNRLYEQALHNISLDIIDATQTKDVFHFDAFISYSHKDKIWVEDILLPKLEREGLHLCIDYRDFDIGVPSLINMENAIKRSRKTLLILTPSWVTSEWTAFESLLIQVQDPINLQQRILPILVQPSELPSRLQIFTNLDLTTSSDFDRQMGRLIEVIRAPQL